MIFLLADISVFFDLLALSQRVIHSILSARVVLHLRIAASDERMAKLTSIAFIEPTDEDLSENIQRFDLHDEPEDDHSELESTSSRSGSISSDDTFQIMV